MSSELLFFVCFFVFFSEDIPYRWYSKCLCFYQFNDSSEEGVAYRDQSLKGKSPISS